MLALLCCHACFALSRGGLISPLFSRSDLFYPMPEQVFLKSCARTPECSMKWVFTRSYMSMSECRASFLSQQNCIEQQCVSGQAHPTSTQHCSVVRGGQNRKIWVVSRVSERHRDSLNRDIPTPSALPRCHTMLSSTNCLIIEGP